MNQADVMNEVAQLDLITNKAGVIALFDKCVKSGNVGNAQAVAYQVCRKVGIGDSHRVLGVADIDKLREALDYALSQASMTTQKDSIGLPNTL
jgi:hypothetical protein